MSFSKTFKITKEPRTFQAGESTGFNLSVGSQYYDRKTKQKEWANYSAVIFAKGNQLAFYQQALVIGSIIELSADDLKIDNYNPEYLTIELIDAKLCNIFSAPSQPQQAQAQQPQQAAPQYQQPAPAQQAPQMAPVPQQAAPQYQQAPQHAPQQQQAAPQQDMPYDDNIPF
jgi:single-strand DNA-binding protein